MHFNITVGTVGMQRNLNLIPGLTPPGFPYRNSISSASQPLREPAVWQCHRGLEIGVAGSLDDSNALCTRNEPAGLSFSCDDCPHGTLRQASDSLGLPDELAFECGHPIPMFSIQAMEDVLTSIQEGAKGPEVHPGRDKNVLWSPVTVQGGTREGQEKKQCLGTAR